MNELDIYRNIKVEDIELILMILKRKNLFDAMNVFNLSQPAISARLNKFRYYYKDKLIYRLGNKMELTEGGERLLFKLKDFHEHIETMFEHKMFCPYKKETDIHLYINEYYIYLNGFVSSLIEKFCSFNPSHKIIIQTIPLKPNYILQSKEVYDLLSLDLIIGSTNLLDDFSHEIIQEQNLILAYDKYPGLMSGTLTPESYYHLPHISVDLMIGENFFSKYFDDQDPRNIKLRLQNIKVLREVLSDQYVVTLTKEVAQAIGLNFIELPFHTKTIPIYMLCPSRYMRNDKNKWIRTVVKEVIKMYLAPAHENIDS